MERMLEFNPCDKIFLTNQNIWSLKSPGKNLWIPIQPGFYLIADCASASGNLKYTSKMIITWGECVVSATTLVVATVPVTEFLQNSQRAIKDIDPMVFVKKPHRDGFGPTVGIKLD